jgi:putative Ca2+/H+ antiporter (TMEM165/GDT1 family)
MIDLAIVWAAFILIFLAELGDKTQIAVISLTVQYRSLRSISIGAISAFIAISTVGVLMGTSISLILPFDLIEKLAGSIFIIFGALKIIQREKGQGIGSHQSGDSNALWKTFSLISIAELGDKTQLATIALAAQYNSPVSVLLGVALSFTFLTVIGVAIGDKLSRFVSSTSNMRYFGVVFIIIGLWMILP